MACRFLGKSVAVKMADAFNSRDIVCMLDNEVAAYADLAPLQGDCLPKLVAYGHACNGLARFLATSLVLGKRLDEADATSATQFASALQVGTPSGVALVGIAKNALLINSTQCLSMAGPSRHPRSWPAAWGPARAKCDYCGEQGKGDHSSDSAGYRKGCELTVVVCEGLAEGPIWV